MVRQQLLLQQRRRFELVNSGITCFANAVLQMSAYMVFLGDFS